MPDDSSFSAHGEHLAPSSTEATYLHGRWLLIARVGWIALTVLILTLSAIAIPKADALLQSVCQSGTTCLSFQLTQADLRLLQQLGLSPGFLAAYRLGLDGGTTLIYSALAAFIFWRRSQEWMALFCAYMLVLFGGATYTGLLDTGLRSVAPVWYWLVGGLELLGQVSVPTFFLLFPNGRFLPRWSRWGVLVVTLYEAWYVFFPWVYQDVSTLVFAVFLLCLVGLQVYRYRRVSTFRERQQTKWVIFGLASALGGLALILFIGTIFVPPDVKSSQVVGDLTVGTASDCLLLLIPLSIAMAILRSRLYEIDTIINKALVYGLLTSLLAAVYAGLIIGLASLARLFGGTTAQNPVVLVVATLAVFALFLPARRRIQAIIDQRFYRKKYDAERTLVAFSAALRSEVTLEQLRMQLLAVVTETMQPAHVSLWLRQPQRHPAELAHRLEPQGASGRQEDER